MILIFILIVFLVISMILIYIYYKKEGYFSTISFFIISVIIYYVAIPVELSIIGDNGYFKDRSFIEVTYYNRILLLTTSLLSVLAFFFGYYLSKFKLTVNSLQLNQQNSGYLLQKSVYFLLLISSSILIIFYFDVIIASMSGYRSNYTNTYNNSTYSYFKSIFILSLAIVASIYLCTRGKEIIGILLIIIGFSFGVMTSDKNPILISLLPLVLKANIIISNNKIKISTIFFVIIAFVVVLFSIPIFSLYRAGVDIFSLDIVSEFYFSFTRIDPSGPFISLASVLKEEFIPTYGIEYLKNIEILIPKSIWTERPLDLAERFAQDNIKNWQPGEGMGFSLMAEGILSFGYYLSFFHYLFIGLFWGYSWRFIAFLSKNDYMVNIIYRIVGFYIIIIMHRGPSLTIVKDLIHFFVPLFLILVTLNILRSLLKERDIQTKYGK